MMDSKMFSGGLMVVLALFLTTGCTSTGDTKDDPSAGNPAIQPKSYTVEIAMMKFTPSTLSVHKGDTIIFVNNDMVTHDVTEQKEKAWRSSTLAAGNTWSMVAMTSSDYYCSIHPVMTGKFIVE
ncbi:MAG TPA: cupredoxin domain-containing protein [Chitinophagaceae bacterium]|nr:cupredoxin domain-containing protein [Chitinophagaceae bacterium]